MCICVIINFDMLQWHSLLSSILCCMHCFCTWKKCLVIIILTHSIHHLNNLSTFFWPPVQRNSLLFESVSVFSGKVFTVVFGIFSITTSTFVAIVGKILWSFYYVFMIWYDEHHIDSWSGLNLMSPNSKAIKQMKYRFVSCFFF